jgi:hypothetical protein
VKELAAKVYWHLAQAGEHPCIVNERYIGVNGATYQIIKSKAKGHWTVKEI